MASLIDGNPMVWAFVQIKDGVEAYAGQHIEDLDVIFIPVFLERDAAEACLPMVKREKGAKVEFHAVRFRELEADAARSGFLLFVLDADGVVLEKLVPSPGGREADASAPADGSPLSR